MPLFPNEVEKIMDLFKCVLDTQAQIAADRVSDKQEWKECTFQFNKDVLDHLEDTIYRNMGVQ